MLHNSGIKTKKRTGPKSEKAIERLFAKNNAKPLIRTTNDPTSNQKLKNTPTKHTMPNWPHYHAAVVEKSKHVVKNGFAKLWEEHIINHKTFINCREWSINVIARAKKLSGWWWKNSNFWKKTWRKRFANILKDTIGKRESFPNNSRNCAKEKRWKK